MTQKQFEEIFLEQIEKLRDDTHEKGLVFSEFLKSVSELYANRAKAEEEEEAERALKTFKINVMDVNCSIYQTGPCVSVGLEEFRQTFIADLQDAKFLNFPDGSSVAVDHIVSFKIIEFEPKNDQD